MRVYLKVQTNQQKDICDLQSLKIEAGEKDRYAFQANMFWDGIFDDTNVHLFHKKNSGRAVFDGSQHTETNISTDKSEVSDRI